MTAGRNPVSVVMPFAGTRDEALAAVESLGRLRAFDGDELLLADNAGVLAGAGGIEMQAATGVAVAICAAAGERSPAHARNAGAAAAVPGAEWILFLDADTSAPADLIDRYFAEPIADDVGALAGGIRAAPAAGGDAGLAARYGAYKNFLDAGAHLAHPYLPRAAAANLLVRRSAFDGVGGFVEGVRAAEDTDFCWRLQLAGWRLLACPDAVVEHRYRDSIAALRRQWRSYAAGRAWLSRRYDGFVPRPALVRAGSRAVAAARGARPASAGSAPGAPQTAAPAPGAPDAAAGAPASPPAATRVSLPTRAGFAAIDVLLGIEELIGLAQANRPAGPAPASGGPFSSAAADEAPASPGPGPAAPASFPASAHRVLVADRFPAPDVAAAPGARIEAAARPERPETPAPGVTVTYREDDGLAERAAALLRVALDAPAATAAAIANDPRTTLALAPAARRLRADPDATLAAAGPAATDDVPRLARLAGRSVQP